MIRSRLRHPLWALVAALGLTVPWILVMVTVGGEALSTGPQVLLSGVGVLGAAFLLAWAAETAEKDVPRAFAIAVLAVLAVAPEYAVDALYAWNAGAGGATLEGCAQLTREQITAEATPMARACHEANLAIANMTGANRILIGLGWSGIALYTVWTAWKGRPDVSVEPTERFRDAAVELDRDLALEILFLFLATMFAFTVPFAGGLGALDTAVLLGLYVLYIVVVIRGDVEEVEGQVGVPRYLQARRRAVRVLSAVILFAYSGLIIFVAVEPFAHGLEEVGIHYGIPQFFMIQWFAPLASESPELIVVIYLVNKARSTAAFNTLISSKLNQWTLLIGTLALVYSLALGRYGVLPFDSKQAAEIWITAGQSLFAIAILIDFRISVTEAVALLVLFLSQVITEFVIIQVVPEPQATEYSILLLDAYSVVYVVAALGLLWLRRRALREVIGRSSETIQQAWGDDTELQPAGGRGRR